VENRAWRNNYDAGLLRHVLDGVFASVNPMIVDRLLQDTARPIERVRFYFGHAVWLPSQQKRELDHHDWRLADL